MKRWIQRLFWFSLSFGLVLGLYAPSSAKAQGFLIPTDQTLPPLALQYHRVQVKIRDRAAQTRVEQVFVNSTSRVLEATYIFPLPPDATVSNFVLYINGQPTQGRVLEKNRAASIYQSIVSRMRDPGLLEYLGGRLFRARIFPIPARGEQKIAISFTQVVPYMGGIHRYVYPLKTSHALVRTQRDFTMSVELLSQSPLKNIYSPTHQVSVARRGDRKAIIGFEQNQAALNRDFVLFYSVSPKDLGMNLLTHRIEGQDGYFLMMATPKVAYGSNEILGKNITFVLDTSGSMSGEKMKWAKHALLICLGKLNPKDYFNVVRFSTDVESLFQELKPADAAHVKQATEFVQRMEAAGGTAIDDAMKLALEQKPKGPGLSMVVFITDGHPTIGETSPETILKHAKIRNKTNTRIFTFGIGTDINTKLLDQMAIQGGGTGDYVKPDQEISQRIAWFYDKVRYPVLSDIQMKVGGAVRLYDVYPKQIPDLFRGGQILLFGRYRGVGDAAVQLFGKVGGAPRRYVFESGFAKASLEHDFIAKLWAHRKVAYLLENIRLHGENAELKQEVIRLAKKFGIVTPYTSYLVLEKNDQWRYEEGERRPLVQHQTGRWHRRSRQNFGVAPQGGATAQPSTPAPSNEPRAATRGGDDSDSIGKSEALRDSSGLGAVRTSRALRKMKARKVVSSLTSTRYIQGKVFVFSQGMWTDQAYKTSMKTLRVKYLSPTYFQILTIRPDLRKILALGSRLVVVVSRQHALIIDDTDSSVSTSQLRSFLKR